MIVSNAIASVLMLAVGLYRLYHGMIVETLQSGGWISLAYVACGLFLGALAVRDTVDRLKR
ncbi:MAG: hypothetical protein ABEJ86_00015 [Halococcoides sp.]